MTAPRAARCQTCGDAAEQMSVLEADPARSLAVCADGEGVRVGVDTSLLGPVSAGEILIVVAGAALARAPR